MKLMCRTVSSFFDRFLIPCVKSHATEGQLATHARTPNNTTQAKRPACYSALPPQRRNNPKTAFPVGSMQMAVHAKEIFRSYNGRLIVLNLVNQMLWVHNGYKTRPISTFYTDWNLIDFISSVSHLWWRFHPNPFTTVTVKTLGHDSARRISAQLDIAHLLYAQSVGRLRMVTPLLNCASTCYTLG